MADMKSKMDKKIKQIHKEYGEGVISDATEAKALDIERIKTGSFSMDVEMGGGVPENRITAFTGPEGGGKSTMSLKIIGNAQDKYPEKYAVFVDSEHSLDKYWAEQNGVDLERLKVVRPEYAEQAFEILENLIREEGVCIGVVDSLTALTPSKELESSMEDQQMGLKPRINSKFLRKFNSALARKRNLRSKDNNTTLITIAQVREDLGGWGSKEVMPGGRAIRHWSSIIASLRGGDWIERKIDGNKLKVGREMKFYINKNKTYSPKRQSTFDLYMKDYDWFEPAQIDRVKELVSYAIHWRIVTKNGAWYQVDGYEDKFHGAEQLVNFFRENDEARKEMEKEVLSNAINFEE